MKYKLAGGNVAVADYETGCAVLAKAGMTVSEAIRNLFAYMARSREVPDAVLGSARVQTDRRMAAFEELNALTDSTPRVPWTEGDSREDVRDILQERYV